MTDNANFGWGGGRYPLTSSTAQSLLVDADKALATALTFWSAVLNAHLGARLTAEAAIVGVTAAAPVAFTLPIDPGPFLFEHAEVRFPLLAAYRLESTYGDRTATWENSRSEWEVLYVLPTLNPAAAQRVVPILHAVEHVLVHRTALGFDPSYAGGAHVWQTAGIQSIAFLRGSFGRLDDSSGLYLYCYRGRVAVTERVMPVTGDLEAYVGADVDEQTVDGTTLDNTINFKTDVSSG